VETYPQGSRTFRENGSTEVLEKEEREVWKKSGKLLIEKKKRECGPKLRLTGEFWYQFGTEEGKSYPQERT
jgi:hypothetical protein